MAYILEALCDTAMTAFHTAINAFFLIVEFLQASLQRIFIMVFNPAKDIPSLAGKVILVTGGAFDSLPYNRYN